MICRSAQLFTLLTTLLASRVAAAQAAQATPAADRGTAEPREPGLQSPEGFVATLGGGALYTGGELGAKVDLAAVVATLDLGVGAYLTPHLGVLGGVRLGYAGFATAGCDGCTARTFQLPVVVQYAFDGRQKGAYLEGGLGLLQLVSMKTSDGKASLDATAGADVKIGVGYRVLQSSKDKALLPGAIDLKLGADIGRYSAVELKEGSVGTKADIAEEKRALHYTVGFTLAYVITR
jgi:hypothetical protein